RPYVVLAQRIESWAFPS
ncbi:MAG: hypothetical protein EZS28_043852, partial [Streblomastix strix]